MKIALVIERMDAGRGGRETSTAQIACELARRGHEVTILCERGRAPGEGMDVEVLGRHGLGRAVRVRSFARSVRDLTAGGAYDVVHAMLPVPGADVYQLRSGTVPAQRLAGRRRRTLLGAAAAMALEPLNRSRRARAALEREVLADPKVLCLPVSEMVARELGEFYGRTENVRVVFNAVDVPDVEDEQRADWRQERRFRLGVKRDDFVLLSVAKNLALKGAAELVEGFARWHHGRRGGGDARLVVVGGDVTEGYQRHAGLRDVGSHVHFVPPTEDVFAWYAAADAVALLSWYDPCSRVILEAVRWGVPSLTTAFNGAAEVLADGAGVVVPSPRERRTVAEGIARLADPDRREQMTAACSEIAPRLGIARHVDELLEAYRSIGRL